MASKEPVSERVLTLQGEVIGVSVPRHYIRYFADQPTWEKADYLANRILATPKDLERLRQRQLLTYSTL